MTTPVDVANLALFEQGSRVRINDFSDTSPQAQVAQTFYTPKMQALLRTANWDFARGQATLSVWKAVLINGVVSADPPPQPFLFSYLWPTDCLKARFILPTMPTQTSGTPATTNPNQIAWIAPAPTAIPFVVATDRDALGNPIKVILTNLPNAQLIYTRDLSQVPDLWDSLFLSAATAFLAAYFINALSRNKAQYDDQVAMAKSLIDQARMANNNESINSIDHAPDWLRARRAGGSGWFGPNYGGNGGMMGGGWDSVTMPDGLSY